jgi:hypothetical protein
LDFSVRKELSLQKLEFFLLLSLLYRARKYLKPSSESSLAARNSYGAKQFSRSPTESRYLVRSQMSRPGVTENRNVRESGGVS